MLAEESIAAVEPTRAKEQDQSEDELDCIVSVAALHGRTFEGDLTYLDCQSNYDADISLLRSVQLSPKLPKLAL